MSKPVYFFPILMTLPFAAAGYDEIDPKKRHEILVKAGLKDFSPNVWEDLNEIEKNGLKKILKPHFDKNQIEDHDLVEYCLTCLFRAIKIWITTSGNKYKVKKPYFEGVGLQAKEIKDLIELLRAKELKKAEFYLKNDKKITFKGYSLYLLEVFFIHFEKFKWNKRNLYTKDKFVFALNELKGYYDAGLSQIAEKRQYKKKMDFDEFHRVTVRNICKQLHIFLVKYSSLVPKGNKTSNDELRLIIDFLKLTKLEKFDDLGTLRSLIVR